MEIRLENISDYDLCILHILAMSLQQKPRTQIGYNAPGREDHILHYHVSGQRVYYQDKKEIFRLHPGDVILLPMGSRYETVAEGTEGALGHNIRFLLKNETGESVGIAGGPRKLLRDESGRLLPFFQELQSLSLKHGMQMASLACLARLLEEIEKELSQGVRDEWLPRVLDQMGNHLSEPLSLGELAACCHMSQRSFCRKFKEETGMPPIEFYRQMRLEKAEKFLQGGATLEMTAGVLGFTDASHLSRLLKKSHGCN